MEHLAEEDVEAFLKGSLERQDRLRVVRHLVTGCAVCGAKVFAAAPADACLPPGPRPDEEIYEKAFDRAWRSVRGLTRRWAEDQERLARALGWVREKGGLLSELTPAQTRSILPWNRVEILLQLSMESRFRDPARMLDYAKNAQEVASRIEKAPYGPGFVADLQARTWIELTNALRVNELYLQAEAAVRYARVLLEKGSGDLLLQARLDDVEGSLRKDQRRFEEAAALLSEAHAVYLHLGETHLAGRTLVNKGLALRLAGDPNEAARVLREALSLLEPERDPGLVASARHNLFDSLVDAGRLGEAGEVFFESGLRQAFADDPQSLLRLRWVEAKMLSRRGRLADAARVLGDVRTGFRSQGLEYVAAVAGADEAAVLLRLGRKKEAHLLALDLWLTFQRHGIHAEAERALRFLETACRTQAASPDLAERVGRFLEDARRDRGLRFDPERLIRK